MTEPGSNADRYLDAAFDAFMRTGFAKTTMADIAAAAGVSRPTLYRSFATKEAVFLGVARRLHAATQQACRDAAEESDASLDRRLAAMSTAKLSAHIELVQSSPHGIDLLDLHQRIGGDLARAADDHFRDLVTATLRQADGSDIDLATHGLTPARAAAIVVSIVDGWERRILHRGPMPTRRWSNDLADAVAVVVRGLAPIAPR